MHAAEVARFRSKIVAGPGDRDCGIWIGSIGADGYGLHHPCGHGILRAAPQAARCRRTALAIAGASMRMSRS